MNLHLMTNTVYMQPSQINRVIQLVRKTGDKVVLMDNESDAVMMLMDLDAYEKMVASSPQPVETMTEEELMERINRDVAVWRAYNDKERLETMDTVLEKNQVQAEPAKASDNQASQASSAKPIEMAKQSDFSKTEHQIPAVPEESASDIAAEEDEEKFYLEPVE